MTGTVNQIAWAKQIKTEVNADFDLVEHSQIRATKQSVIYHRPRFCGWGPSFEAGDFASSTLTVRSLKLWPLSLSISSR